MDVLEHLDRHARPITTWAQFYQWLGRGHGWAFFPCDSAQRFVPHWFSDDLSIACQQLQDENGTALVGAPFVDVKMIGTGLTEEAQKLLQRGWEEMTGDSDNLGGIYSMQIQSNMLITEQRLFVN